MDPDKASISSYKTDDSEIGEEQFMRWKDWQEWKNHGDPKSGNNVNAIFSEGLMIAVSLILIPVLIIPYSDPSLPIARVCLTLSMERS